MAGTAYHMEALRKTRVMERKTDAMRRLKESIGQSPLEAGTGTHGNQPDPVVFSEVGHYQQTRHNYWRIGRERDRKQYDHSRYGPVVDKTKYELKREFNFLGNSLGMLKDDIRPAHKPIPVCRRY